MAKFELSNMEKDVLREMGNMGTENAEAALSKFVSKDVVVNIPETKFLQVVDFSKEYGGPNKIVASIFLQVMGELNGGAMFVFGRKTAPTVWPLSMIFQLWSALMSIPLLSMKSVKSISSSKLRTSFILSVSLVFNSLFK